MTVAERVLLLDDITVRYGSRTACAHVSLEVRRGEVFALLGRNGAGKSSLIRCLLGQKKAQSGRACLFGADVWRNRRRLLARVGVVPEEPDAPPDMTAKQIAGFCSGFYSVWDRSAFWARLDSFGIPARVPFQNLSKGQKSMTQFALALAHHPELLVLDDPSLGLDAVARKAIFEDLVGDLAERAPTVLIATHDLAGIEGIADRVGILDAGRVLLDMELEKVKSRYRRLRYLDGGSARAGAGRPELAPFTVIGVREEGTVVEAVVSDYDEDKSLRFCASPAVSGVAFSPMSLEEIVIAVAGAKTGGPS